MQPAAATLSQIMQGFSCTEAKSPLGRVVFPRTLFPEFLLARQKPGTCSWLLWWWGHPGLEISVAGLTTIYPGCFFFPWVWVLGFFFPLPLLGVGGLGWGGCLTRSRRACWACCACRQLHGGNDFPFRCCSAVCWIPQRKAGCCQEVMSLLRGLSPKHTSSPLYQKPVP